MSFSNRKVIEGLDFEARQTRASICHDLQKLALLAGLEISKKDTDVLNEISSFNIAGRYGDEKFAFYKNFNKKDKAKKYVNLTKELLVWLKKESLKK